MIIYFAGILALIGILLHVSAGRNNSNANDATQRSTSANVYFITSSCHIGLQSTAVHMLICICACVRDLFNILYALMCVQPF